MNRNSEIISDVVRVNLDLVEKHLISQIADLEARALAISAVNDMERIVNALLDENPEDRAQVLEIVRNFASEPLLQYGELELTEAINRLSRPELKALLLQITPTLSSVFRLLVDGDKDNNKQVEELFVNLVKSPGFITSALALLLSLLNRAQRA